MSSRFEQIITGAVVTGAIALAGCASSGGDDGTTVDPVQSNVEFFGARAISGTQVKLFFSDEVALPADVNALAAQFSLFGTDFTATISPAGQVNSACTNLFTGFSGTTTTNSFTYYSCEGPGSTFYDTWYTAVEAVYRAQDGAEIAAITEVETSPDDARNVIVSLDANIALIDGVDDFTGVLRLQYTGSEDGLVDADGAFLPAIEIPSLEILGNVGIPDGGPVMIFAHTIAADQVELWFNEPITINGADLNAAIAQFNISENEICHGTGSQIWYDFAGIASAGPGFAGFNSYLSPNVGNSPAWDFDSSAYGVSGSVPAIVSITQPAPHRLILHMASVIGEEFNHAGYLRLTFTAPVPGSGEILSVDSGNATLSFGPGSGTKNRGNLKDEANPAGSNVCVL